MKKADKNRPERNKRIYENVKLGFLLFASIGIIVGSYFLFWQIQKQNAPENVADQNNEMRSEIESLNNKIDELKNALVNVETKTETKTEVESEVVSSGSGKVAGESSGAGGSEISGKINLNTAGVSELDALPGIGPAYAQRIIDYRESNGGFASIEDVQNVKGIGPKTFEKMKDLITV